MDFPEEAHIKVDFGEKTDLGMKWFHKVLGESFEQINRLSPFHQLNSRINNHEVINLMPSLITKHGIQKAHKKNSICNSPGPFTPHGCASC